MRERAVALRCPEPVLPDFSELSAEDLAKVAGGPLRCVRCGGELELRCPEGHLYVAPRTLAYPRADKGKPQPHKPHAYKPKPCKQCGETFQPSGGRDDFCPQCKATRGAA